MVLNKIKSKELNGGFTIVELLVVIVVIGILAAITVVSYTGITTKANKAAAIQNSSSVAAAADAYFAENQSYPAAISNISDGTVKVPSTIGLKITVPSGTTTPASITYIAATTGYCIQYWDGAAKQTFATAGTGATCL